MSHVAANTAARIPLPDGDALSPDQRAVFDAVIAGPRGRLVGPLRAALHNPALADRWQKLGQVLRYETSLARDISELAILVVARHWSSDLEWTVHAAEAAQVGLDPAAIAAIGEQRAPDMLASTESGIYEYVRQLLSSGRVSDACYAEVLQRHGIMGVVELTALVGYYSMVAMTLNAHQIPLPDGMASTLPPGPALTLPPIRLS